jgi:hypothetical protein
MFRFWLDDTKPTEKSIVGQIQELKENRQFTGTIREGIQLITSLREGDVEMLFELFPWIRLEMMEYFQSIGLIPADISQHMSSEAGQTQSVPETATAQQVSEALKQEQQQIEQLRAEQEAYERDLERWAEEREKQIAAQWAHIEREKERLAAEREKNQSAIEEKLEKLEKLLIQQGNQPIERPGRGRGGGPKPLGGLSGGPQPLGGNNLPPPTFDDDEDADLLEVKESEGGNSNASMNFIKSVQRLMEWSDSQ